MRGEGPRFRRTGEGPIFLRADEAQVRVKTRYPGVAKAKTMC